MCVKFFFGYICGHCSTPWIVKCPTVLASPKYPACSIPAEKAWDTYKYCHPCSRVDWNNKVLADEKLHREAHLTGEICCDVIFKEENRKQRLEHIKNKANKGKGKPRIHEMGHVDSGVGPSNANHFESENRFANMGKWNGAGPVASVMQFENLIGSTNNSTIPNNYLGASSPNMLGHFDTGSQYLQPSFPPFVPRVPRPEHPASGLSYSSAQHSRGIVGGNQHGHGITGGDPREGWTQEGKEQAYSYVGYVVESAEKAGEQSAGGDSVRDRPSFENSTIVQAKDCQQAEATSKVKAEFKGKSVYDRSSFKNNSDVRAKNGEICGSIIAAEKRFEEKSTGDLPSLKQNLAVHAKEGRHNEQSIDTKKALEQDLVVQPKDTQEAQPAGVDQVSMNKELNVQPDEGQKDTSDNSLHATSENDLGVQEKDDQYKSSGTSESQTDTLNQQTEKRSTLGASCQAGASQENPRRFVPSQHDELSYTAEGSQDNGTDQAGIPHREVSNQIAGSHRPDHHRARSRHGAYKQHSPTQTLTLNKSNSKNSFSTITQQQNHGQSYRICEQGHHESGNAYQQQNMYQAQHLMMMRPPYGQTGPGFGYPPYSPPQPFSYPPMTTGFGPPPPPGFHGMAPPPRGMMLENGYGPQAQPQAQPQGPPHPYGFPSPIPGYSPFHPTQHPPLNNHNQDAAEPPVVPFQLSSNGTRYYTDEEITFTNPEYPPFPEPLFRFGFTDSVPYADTPTLVHEYSQPPSRPEFDFVESTQASEKDYDGDDDVEIITENKKVIEPAQPVVVSSSNSRKGKGKETSER